MKERLLKFVSWMSNLKNSRKALIFLIVLDLFLAVGSNYADWPWLNSVKWYLLPVAPICSLYTVLIFIWFLLYFFKKNIPGWFTAFIFMAITSYGVMSYVYFPLYMSWIGVDFRNVGNMLWVTVYAIQALILLSEIKPLPVYQYLLIFSYFALKDYSDRFLGSFWDFLRDGYPTHLLLIFSVSMIILHLTAGAAIVLIPKYQPRIRAALAKVKN